MSSHETAVDDVWAWAKELDPAPVDVTMATVHVLVPDGAGTPWLASLLDLCAIQTVLPVRVTVGADPSDPAPLSHLGSTGLLRVDAVPAPSLGALWDMVSNTGADYCWVLPAEAEVPSDTLEKLLRTMVDPTVAATGPVVARRLTRRTDPLIEWVGATLTTTGVPVSYEGVGEVDQGQIETPTVLGLPSTGLLVRTAVLRAVGGFGASPIPGLDIGAMSTLAGGRVVVTGNADITLLGPATGSPVAARRAGMNLASVLAKSGPWHAITTVVGSLAGALGYLLGRDPREARVVLSALTGWMRDGAVRHRLRARLAPLPIAPTASVRELRPSGMQRLVHWGEGALGAIGDWIDGFSVRVESGSVIDDLTSSDSSDAGRWRLSPALVGFVALLALAFVSAGTLLRPGLVTGQELLPAPSFSDLWQTYLGPVAGQPGGSGPPWLAIVGLVSLLTLGHVDFAVFATLVLIVPMTWLAAYRLMRHLLSEQPQAVASSAVIALSPALVGATNRGDIGTPVAVLFVILGLLAGIRLVSEGSWRWAATVAACVTIAGSIQPLLWLAAAVIGAWAVFTRWITWTRLVVVLVAPIVAIAPWIPTLWRWPGRLLTGPEPALATTDAPGVLLLLGRDAGDGLAPLWVSIVVVGALWLLALAGSVRAGRRSMVGWIVALTGLVCAVVLTKFVVAVPPGVAARPSATFWLALFVAGLAVAAALGTDRIVDDLRDAALGWRQITVAAGAVLAVGLTLISLGWWTLGAERDLHRDELTSIPPFVANAQTDSDPGRTLAIRMSGDRQATWALLEEDMPRLGDGERGTAAGGSATAMNLAAGVVDRLLAGSADDLLLSDLQELGVGYIWVSGANQGELSNIGNTPGLGIGSGDESMWVWPVPQSAIATVTDDGGSEPVGDGTSVKGSDSDRELILSEPDDPRWVASVDGKALEALPTTDWRQRFAMPSDGGELTYELAGARWWSWIELAVLVVWVLMVLPNGRRAVTPGMRGGVS